MGGGGDRKIYILEAYAKKYYHIYILWNYTHCERALESGDVTKCHKTFKQWIAAFVIPVLFSGWTGWYYTSIWISDICMIIGIKVKYYTCY